MVLFGDYINITIDDVTKYDQLLVYDDIDLCVANFVPKCIFKPVEAGDVISEVSFPFARFANGANPVEIKFSINGSESNVNSELTVRNTTPCKWTGMTADSGFDPKYCRNLTKNEADDRLDYTFVYKLEEWIGDQEPVELSNFVFTASSSGIAVSVYWKKKGESPDIVECRKHGNPFTTSSENADPSATTTSSGKHLMRFE
nr:diagnostic antigen gp50 [Hymenolepis microstoma]